MSSLIPVSPCHSLSERVKDNLASGNCTIGTGSRKESMGLSHLLHATKHSIRLETRPGHNQIRAITDKKSEKHSPHDHFRGFELPLELPPDVQQFIDNVDDRPCR